MSDETDDNSTGNSSFTRSRSRSGRRIRVLETIAEEGTSSNKPGAKRGRGHRNRRSEVFAHALKGLSYDGTNFVYWFLEICSGSAVLTQAVRFMGMTACEPVDLITGWDITLAGDRRILIQRIKEWRPLLTHMAPDCRIFSQAFHPHQLRCYTEEDPRYKNCMELALGVGEIAHFIARLRLFVSIENPGNSRLFKLMVYVGLHQRPGFYFVALNGCMYGFLHSLTKLPVRKACCF